MILKQGKKEGKKAEGGGGGGGREMLAENEILKN